MIDLRTGDCIELAQQLDDNSIDCTVTSPPYNKQKIGGGLFRKIEYDKFDDSLPEDVYQEQQLDESDDLESLQSAAQKSVDRLRRGNRITRAGAHIAAHKVARDVKKASAYGPQRPRAGQTGAYRIEGPKPSGSKPGAYRMEQVDIYDIILSHLLDEGYAETPEAAEVIMVNMSEEWIDSIVG